MPQSNPETLRRRERQPAEENEAAATDRPSARDGLKHAPDLLPEAVGRFLRRVLARLTVGRGAIVGAAVRRYANHARDGREAPGEMRSLLRIRAECLVRSSLPFVIFSKNIQNVS